MEKIIIIIIVSFYLLQVKNIQAQSKFDSLVSRRSQLLAKYTSLSPGQKIDTGSFNNISEIFIIENLIINEEKQLSGKIRYADSIKVMNISLQAKIRGESLRAKNIRMFTIISAGGFVMIFLVLLILFIFTRIRLNKRIRELRQVKKSYDVNFKEKSDYEQSLLLDIENLTNGYKSMELKVKELESGIHVTPLSSSNISDKNTESSELFRSNRELEKKYLLVSELNSELEKKSNELALKNIELADKINRLVKESSKAKYAGFPDTSQNHLSKSESQKTMDEIDVNFYKIEKLNKLKEIEAISHEEYESLKKTILGKIN